MAARANGRPEATPLAAPLGKRGASNRRGGRAQRLLGDVVRRAAAILDPRSRLPPTGLPPPAAPRQAALAFALPPLAVGPRRPKGRCSERVRLDGLWSGWPRGGGIPVPLCSGTRATRVNSAFLRAPRGTFGCCPCAWERGARKSKKRRRLVWKDFFINSAGRESEARWGGCDGLSFLGGRSGRKETARGAPPTQDPPSPSCALPPRSGEGDFYGGGSRLRARRGGRNPCRPRAQRIPPPWPGPPWDCWSREGILPVVMPAEIYVPLGLYWPVSHNSPAR